MTVMPKPPVKTVTSREFNQNTSEAKRAATQGPVFVTDRGLPAYVLLSIEEYRRLTTKPMSLAEALEQKVPRISTSTYRNVRARVLFERPTYPNVSARHQCCFGASGPQAGQQQSLGLG